MTEFVTPKCCDRPAIHTMDHTKGWRSDQEGVIQMVNRCCTRCWTHWHGRLDGEIKQYTRKQWDDWINQAFSDENK